ncbi:MAG: hypothetical protein ACOYBL_11525 [Lachnospiraceae bacterium]|jgi:hypothetical protein
MKKKIFYMLCMMACVSMLAACGNKETDTEEESSSETAEEAEQPEATEEEFKDRENIDLGLLAVYYPESWKYDEEGVRQEETYCAIDLYDGATLDNSQHIVYIRAEAEDAYSFRRDLLAYDISLEDYAKEKLETVSIGNADYTLVEENTYTYRHAPSGISYTIRMEGEMDDSVEELLEGIILGLQDEGNVDAPWPWDGTPYEPELSEQMVGSYTIVPEYIPIEDSDGVMDIMDHQFAQYGGQIFHLLDDKLDTYDYTDSGLKFVSSMELEKSCEYLTADRNGMLYLSPGIGEVFGVQDGQKAFQSTVSGDLSMHPSGEWGISFWVGSDTLKATSQDGNLVSEPWILTGLNDDATRVGPFSMISDIAVTENYIMVAGHKAEEDNTVKIVVYDYDGNQILELGGADYTAPDCLGAITGMAETENGFVATDGNMRDIVFWAKDGTHLGSIRTSDIFGTDYPWLEDMQLMDDGSIMIMLTQERDDGSADELMFFRLTGF